MAKFTFLKEFTVRGTEKRTSPKSGKDYTLVIVDDEDGRTLDIYYPGLIHIEKDKKVEMKLQFQRAFGKDSISLIGTSKS